MTNHNKPIRPTSPGDMTNRPPQQNRTAKHNEAMWSVSPGGMVDSPLLENDTPEHNGGMRAALLGGVRGLEARGRASDDKYRRVIEHVGATGLRGVTWVALAGEPVTGGGKVVQAGVPVLGGPVDRSHRTVVQTAEVNR